jgi:hypothetical protein
VIFFFKAFSLLSPLDARQPPSNVRFFRRIIYPSLSFYLPFAFRFLDCPEFVLSAVEVTMLGVAAECL